MIDLIDVKAWAKLSGIPEDRIGIMHHDSIHDAVAAGTDSSTLVEGFGDDESSKRKKRSFCGTSSWEEMEQVIRTGWVKGRRSVAAGLKDIFSSNSSSISSGSYADYDVAGDYPDVERYLTGEPDHMLSYGAHSAAKPVIKLVVNVVVSACVDTRFIINRGSAVAALVDEIESAGNSCEIITVFPTEGHKALASYSVTVKKAGEVLSIDDIAFGLGHPSMVRRVIFSMLERHPFVYGKGYRSGYGRCVDIPVECLPYDVIYLDYLSNTRDYSTADEAMNTVRSKYVKQAEAKGLAVA